MNDYNGQQFGSRKRVGSSETKHKSVLYITKMGHLMYKRKAGFLNKALDASLSIIEKYFESKEVEEIINIICDAD